ncbi:transposase [Bacillus rhizoplanae]|uniref:transposase n=1 Tax=Bacillus rhizoplanae TaxID=2880966 RepID=UPI003D197C13
MGKHRDPEFKEYVAKLILEEGRVARELAYELELPYSTISGWVSAYKKKLNISINKEEYISPKELEKLKRQHDVYLKQRLTVYKKV